MSDAAKPDTKQFSLKNIELNLIANNQARSQQSLYDICTFIAAERLAYQVTPQTQFRVEDGKLFISEHPVEAELPSDDPSAEITPA